MKITIENCRFTPKWETLEQAVQEALGEPRGKFTRISRPDRHANYRSPGKYELDFNTGTESISILLEVKV